MALSWIFEMLRCFVHVLVLRYNLYTRRCPDSIEFTDFDECVHPCKSQPCPDREHFHYPEKLSRALSHPSPPRTKDNHSSDTLLYHKVVLLFLDLHLKKKNHTAEYEIFTLFSSKFLSFICHYFGNLFVAILQGKQLFHILPIFR